MYTRMFLLEYSKVDGSIIYILDGLYKPLLYYLSTLEYC